MKIGILTFHSQLNYISPSRTRVAERQILSINFEEMENEPCLDRHKLYERIMSAKEEDKLKQELAVFRMVKDNYPKYIFTLDQVFVPDHDGVKTISVYDFLLGNDF